MMNFEKLGLYYEASIAGFDGECFDYSVYFADALTDEKFEAVKQAIIAFQSPYEEKDIYLGYITVEKKEEKVWIYLDLGNVKPENENTAIEGILKALNNVSGIKSVILNEDCDFEF